MLEVGKVYNGFEILEKPYMVENTRTYKCHVKCVLCGDKYDKFVQDIQRREHVGCGCDIDGKITKNGTSFYDWCVQNGQTYLLQLWDSDLNSVTPQQVSSVTSKQYYFKCPCERHESFLCKIINLTRHIKTKSICSKCNSFAQHLIDLYGQDALDKYWDYERNIIDPWILNYGSKTTIYIKCQDTTYHGSYDTNAKSVLRGRGCPYCRHLRVHPNDSFAAYCNKRIGNNAIDQIWDYEKNTMNPWEIAPTSNVYVYLKCPNNPNHPSYKILLHNVFKTKYHCPQCALENQDSTLQTGVVAYITDKYGYQIDHEYNCSIKLKNPKTNRWLRYDNEIILSNQKRLIIEVHGMQHYIADCGYNIKRAKKLGITTQDILLEQQYRDELKRQYALDNGFSYLAIPYTAEENNLYQQLIDDKIQEILSQTQQNE